MQTYGVELELPERTNEVAGQYASACLDLAAELGLPGVDLWNGFQAVEGWQEALLDDGLHLTPEGNAKVHEMVMEAIGQKWPHLVPDAMPFDLPDWSVLAEADGQSVETVLHAHFKERDATRQV